MPVSRWARDARRFLNKDINKEIEERLGRVVGLDPEIGSEYDGYGASRETLSEILPYACFLYKLYFRVETHGLENVAAMKRALITPNHMTPVPVDATNICTAFFLEPEPPRFVRSVTHYLLAGLPFLSTITSRSGQVIGHPDNARGLFQEDNLILLFPEGAEAFRLYKNRYKLNAFNIGFMEMAIRYDYPIIPTAVIGSEESVMIIAEWKALNNKFGFFNFPITLTFPWLGLPGILPLPAKFRIYFGEPMDFSMHKDKLDDPEAIKQLVEIVKQRVQDMLDEKRAELPSVPFF